MNKITFYFLSQPISSTTTNTILSQSFSNTNIIKTKLRSNLTDENSVSRLKIHKHSKR